MYIVYPCYPVLFTISVSYNSKKYQKKRKKKKTPKRVYFVHCLYLLHGWSIVATSLFSMSFKVWDM